MKLIRFALLCLFACSSGQRPGSGAGSPSAPSNSQACGVIRNSNRPHPWIARLGYWNFNGRGGSGRPSYTMKWLCGGSLITSTVVVTAAHCVSNAVNTRKSLVARLGEMDTTRRGGWEQDINVSRITMHPSFSASSRSHHHDLAVLKLRRPAAFNSYVGTICLPSANFVLAAGQYVRLGGWGEAEFDTGRSATRLKNPTRKVLPLSDCQSSIPYYLLNGFYPGGLGDNKLCIASSQQEPICKGDSGGPVVWYMSRQGRYILVGVISVGVGCGASYPGIDTRVASYVNWILSNR